MVNVKDCSYDFNVKGGKIIKVSTIKELEQII